MTALLNRWGGPASMLGGILWTTYFVTFFTLQSIAPQALDTEPLHAIYSVMIILSVMLFAAGLLGLYARQAGSDGVVAKLGGGTALLGALFFVAGGSLAAFSSTDGVWYVMLGGIALLFASLMLLGVSTLSTQLLGRWSFVPLLVSIVCLAAFLTKFIVVLQFAPLALLGAWLGVFLAALVGVGWTLMGYILWSSRHVESVRAEFSIA